MRELLPELYERLLRSGRFGEICVGAERDAVLDWLASDEAVGPAWAKRMEGHAFYGSHLQVWFQRSVVVMFGLYFRDAYEFSPTVELPGLTLASSTPRSVVLEWLRLKAVSFEERSDQPHLVEAQSGVQFVFHDDWLDSLQISKEPLTPDSE